ncbi:oligosaccharide flippase family protein [Bacillus sp. ISL-18]|uniref:oligosaccharide flippase family protein n=1 Tax=Bacillus sp. ISL-18 TaxID=2819118 RepID=UPI001BED3934|nr:oligosaccharide flippase family protein [Bacillus sp. ISL-18]MBT2657090.1 oligosaccharide flippase family protein [Bacillus sp. ISL-18]
MKINQLKLGSILSYVSLFVSNLVVFFYTPFMLKHLGQAEYGIYALMGSFVGYLGILEFGLGNTVIRYIALFRAQGRKDKESNLIALCLMIYTLIGIICLLFGFVLYNKIDALFTSLSEPELQIARIIFIIMIVNLALSFPFNVFSSIMSGYEKFILPRAVNIIRSILMPCVMIPLLLLGYKSISIVMVQSIFNILAATINIWYVLKVLKIKIRLIYFDKSFFKDLIKYSFYVFLIALVNQIYWNTDQVILGVVSNTVAVSIFAIATQISGLYMALASSTSVLLLPRTTKMVSENANNIQLTDLLIRSARWQFIILGLILCGFFLYGRQFITLWVGSEYLEAWRIAVILMIANTIPLIQQVGVSILQAKNMHGFRSVMYLIIAIVNVIISIPLAKHLGGTGSAIGTAIGLLAGNVIGINLYYYFKLKLQISRFFKELFQGILPSVIFSALLGGGVRELPIESWFGLILKCFLYFCIYIFIMWRFGANESERGTLVAPFFKLKSTIRNKRLLSQ